MNPHHIFRFLLLMVGCTFLAGCAAGVPTGKWEMDAGVQQAFEKGTVLQDHTYYYLGSFAAPDAVIAVNNHFTLRTRIWAQVDMTEQILKGWLSMYRTEYSGLCSDHYGGVILSPDGQQAGIWYSPNIVNIVEMPEPGVLVVFKPHTPWGVECGAPDNASSMEGTQ